MHTIQKNALAVTLLFVATAGLVLAQGPVPRRIHYTINASYRMKLGNYMLPAGKYLLYQVSKDDRNLFALYEGEDREDSPIALIRTVPIDYDRTVDETTIILEYDETSRDATPVMKGWNIPGESGWEIISVTPKNHRVLTRTK